MTMCIVNNQTKERMLFSNHYWRQICLLAYDYGWRPRMPDNWQPESIDDDGPLLHQVEYGLKLLTIEETEELGKALFDFIEGTVKIGFLLIERDHIRKDIIMKLVHLCRIGQLEIH